MLFKKQRLAFAMSILGLGMISLPFYANNSFADAASGTHSVPKEITFSGTVRKTTCTVSTPPIITVDSTINMGEATVNQPLDKEFTLNVSNCNSSKVKLKFTPPTENGVAENAVYKDDNTVYRGVTLNIGSKKLDGSMDVIRYSTEIEYQFTASTVEEKKEPLTFIARLTIPEDIADFGTFRKVVTVEASYP